MVQRARARRSLRSFAASSSGATAVEYGLLTGLIALGLITVVGISGDRIAAVFDFILADIDANGPTASSSSSTSSSGN